MVDIGRRAIRKKKGGGDFKSKDKNLDVVTQQGIAGCLLFDKECLRGAPIFPCASECSHKSQCTKSYYDEVIVLTEKLTTSCETVLYTVDLDNSLTSLPSANSKLQTSNSFLKDTCNVAFVSQHSTLMKNKREHSSSMGGGAGGHDGELYRDGYWVLIPLEVIPTSETASDGETSKKSVEMNEILKLVPKLSPGLFFPSKTTKRAIYIDPNIIIDNISKLVVESYSQPYSEKMEGATAMLIGRGTPHDRFNGDEVDEEEIILQLLDPNFEYKMLKQRNTRVQNSAYRLVKFAVSNHKFGNGHVELLESRWIVHGLQSDDARLFRCDVLGEILKWEVTSDKSALEFMIGLHDMWSRVIVKASGLDPWWAGDDVVAVPERQYSHPGERRRLQQQEEEEVAVVDSPGRNSREEKQASPRAEEEGDESEETDDGIPQDEAEDDDSSEDGSQEDVPGGTSGEGEEERGEFVADAIAQEEVNAGEEKRGDSSDEAREESRTFDDSKKSETDGKDSQQLESSSWMGILSSSKTKYFVRIVPSTDVGIISIESS